MPDNPIEEQAVERDSQRLSSIIMEIRTHMLKLDAVDEIVRTVNSMRVNMGSVGGA